MQKFKLGESSQHGYLDGGVVVVDEVVLDVLQSEGGLAHASVPQHHDAVPAADLDQTDTTILLLLIQYLETKETYILAGGCGAGERKERDNNGHRYTI